MSKISKGEQNIPANPSRQKKISELAKLVKPEVEALSAITPILDIMAADDPKIALKLIPYFKKRLLPKYVELILEAWDKHYTNEEIDYLIAAYHDKINLSLLQKKKYIEADIKLNSVDLISQVETEILELFDNEEERE